MKPLAAIVRALAHLAARLGIRVRPACGCPACDKAERDARTAIGMPIRHPERLVRELPEGDEEWLADVAAQLWPDDEYAQIITETRREDQ